MNEPAAPSLTAPRRGDGFLQSFARGLSVIRSFGAEAPSQTLTEVARRAGLTRAGARRILLTLEALGYVVSQGRRFRLGPKILELGFAYLASLPLRDLAEPVLRALAAELGESCSAAVLDGDEIVCVLRLPAHDDAHAGIGSRRPAFCTATGRMLLAGLTSGACGERLRSMRRPLCTARTATDPATLQAAIDGARAQGWCLVDQESEEGLVALAAPVVDRGGRTVAAIEVGGRPERTPPAAMIERCLPRLLDAARQVSLLMTAKA